MRIHQIKAFAISILVSAMLGGCASQSSKDPLEGLNRGVYKFNDTVDKAVAKPVANAYKSVFPDFIQKGVNNFFNNISNVSTVANDILQLKLDHTMNDLGRLVINTTVGVGGLVDVASMDGIEKRDEDFGQTLGYWGVGDGVYLVLPLFGPSTIRDAAGLAVDGGFLDPFAYANQNHNVVRIRNGLLLTKFIDKRAQYLPGSDLLDEAALDPYAFVRDAYLQRRNNLIHDGNVPQKDLMLEESEEDDGKATVAAAGTPTK